MDYEICILKFRCTVTMRIFENLPNLTRSAIYFILYLIIYEQKGIANLTTIASQFLQAMPYRLNVL